MRVVMMVEMSWQVNEAEHSLVKVVYLLQQTVGRMPSDTVAYKGQRYYPLKKKANASGFLFRDPEFGPTTKSLFCNRPRSTNIEWKRPKVLSFCYYYYFTITAAAAVVDWKPHSRLFSLLYRIHSLGIGKSNLSRITSANPSRSVPNFVQMHRRKGDNVDEILGAIGSVGAKCGFRRFLRSWFFVT